jgi:hypothetical protein
MSGRWQLTILSGNRVVCSHVPGRPLAPIYDVKDKDFQENEAVSPVVNEKYWRPNDLGVCNYFGLVLDSWIVSDGAPQR